MTTDSAGRCWLTVDQAAAYSGFSTRTIRQRVYDGDLPAYMPRGSRLLRIDRADLDAMIEHGGRREALADRIRQVLADHGDQLPDLSDEQITVLARLLPRPAVTAGDHDAA